MSVSTLVAVLDRQAGVVTRSQALAAGLTPHDVDRLLARRRWRPLHPRVYLAEDHPLSDEARVRAAVLWAGDGAVLAGRAAAWWHGLVDRAPPTVVVTVPRRSPAARPGVLARRRLCAPGDVVTLRGLAVPVRPLAVVDAAVEAGAGGAGLLAQALRCGFAPAELRAAPPAPRDRPPPGCSWPRQPAPVTPDTRRGRPHLGNSASVGIATVNCEHRTHRGRPRRRARRHHPFPGPR
jgi:hypothetical protein